MKKLFIPKSENRQYQRKAICDDNENEKTIPKQKQKTKSVFILPSSNILYTDTEFQSRDTHIMIVCTMYTVHYTK